MTLNNIKKALYKEKPIANFMFAGNTGLYYETELNSGDSISFKIPYEDMGDAKFYKEMDAKLLIRYIWE